MNKLYIIGNLTQEPKLTATRTGVPVCTFNVAVNRRFAGQDGQKQTDFFRVSAWRLLGENCAKYLAKGKKVAVVGEASLSMFTGQDGQPRASIEINADEIEFLSPRGEVAAQNVQGDMQGFYDVDDEPLPWD